MAELKRTLSIAFEVILIFSSLFMILLLLLLLGFATEHVLGILESYGQLPTEIQSEKTIRNAMLFIIAIYITIITAFIQWIVGRLRSINESYKNIKGGKNGGKRRKTDYPSNRVSYPTSYGNRKSPLPTLAGIPA